MIYVTHDQVEAMTLGSRIAVFNQGRIEQLGAPLEVYNRPANTFVASFMGAPKINLVERPLASAPQAHQALWAALAGADRLQVQHIGVRPEHLQVHAGGAGVAATVALAEHLGDASILHMRVEGVAALLKAKVAAEQAIQAGSTVFLGAEPQYVLAFDAAGQAV